MKLIYCDESNLEERAGDFLLYGGVIIPCEKAKELSDAINALRDQVGVPQDAIVKFAPVVEPLTFEQYRDFKAQLIQVALDHGVKFMAYAVLHDLAGDPDVARRYGINTICWHFHCSLAADDEHGLVLIDRFNDEGNRVDGHLREKMSAGVNLPHRGNVQLSQIVGFHYSAIGQSHFATLSDIIVGSLRWAINVHCRNAANRESALNLLGVLSPMFWRGADQENVGEMGFCFSPFGIRSRRFHDQYIGLQRFLQDGGIPSDQNIAFAG